MFQIRIAGVTVEIDHRYGYVKRLCRDYRVSGEVPVFTVSASREELERERKNGPGTRGYLESLCLYRKLCLHMLDCDGFLMHSAVLEAGGQAVAFAAKSGVGKSTHVRLWKERFGDIHIINGDKPIYRFIDGQLYACGTPWRGKEGWGSNTMAPLKALCFLERGAENSLEPLPAGEASIRLFHQLLLPREQERMERLLTLADRMLETTPCWLLRCNRDRSAAEVARRMLMGGNTT